MADTDKKAGLLELTTDIVVAHVSNNNLAVGDLPALIKGVYGTLAGLGASEPEQEAPAAQKPAVPIRSSVKPNYLVCLEDGKRLTMLKRYLMTHFQLTPEEYRRKWNLLPDYPMVAPNYTEQRKALAKKIGLGRKPKESAPVPVAEPAPVSAPKRGRPKAAPKDA
ncbi:MAG: MucR family transcriptional regulator [Sphingobium sp.]|nr:MucR family transcriptional regulator [Sphingobium sp.]